MKSIDQVREFHAAMGQLIGDTSAPAFDRVPLRLGLIAEEFKELCESCGYGVDIEYWAIRDADVDVVEAADALADLRYVTEGAAVEWGIPLDAVTDEVHRSNMAKVGGPVREDGKILKPPGWTPPDVASVLARFANPTPTTGPATLQQRAGVGDIDVWPLVLADIAERDAFGRAKYGVPLRANDGRDTLVDAYQEALDLVVYLRKAIEERGK